MNDLPYIPGTRNKAPAPLARFLPPIELGACTTWIDENLTGDVCVLDPFGGAPTQALRLARHGAKVLVAANNPITRFLLEMAADPPSEADFKAALAEIGASRKGGERLEVHLKELYETECDTCKRMVTADAFLWRKDADVPFARIYTCQHCGDSGERLTTLTDAERATALLTSDKLHRSRVLERVAPLNDPDREYAEDAVQTYLPRALYVVTTLVNRLDGLDLSPTRRRALEAMLLTVFDAANTLHPHPVERPRPKQLIVPGQFYEHNLWQTLEASIALWTNYASPTPLTYFPETPEKNGICLFEGKLKELAESGDAPNFDAAITAIPRPNQAFWTLSSLWVGWLWGRESAEHFKVGLRRQRYEWGWHTTALHAAFRHLGSLLPEKAPVFALLAEPEAAFLSAATIAASPAFRLKNLALRTKHDPVQIWWERGEIQKKTKADLEKAIADHLHVRGEAATYLHIHAQGLSELARTGSLLPPQIPVDEAHNRIHAMLEETLKGNPKFKRYEGSEKNIQIGLWGLAAQDAKTLPLADRVEMALVRYLSRNPHKTLLELEQEIYPQFTGLQTPTKALMNAILDSYAERAENGTWRLREKDAPSARHADLDEMRALLTDIGLRLGYETEQLSEKTLVWGNRANPEYVFHLIASALVYEIFSQTDWPREKSLLILPGGRAGLFDYKQKRDPGLHALAENWRFIKFRLLRTTGELPLISKETWDEQVGSDPIERRTQSQLMMF